MTCHIAADDRECMLRHSHARHHRDSGPCLACSTGISRMSRAVEWPPATAEVAPKQPKRRGRPRKTPAVPAPATVPAPVPAPVAPGQPKRRGRPRKAPAVPAPATIPAPAPARVTIDAVRQAVRDALPMAEACALGLSFLARLLLAEESQIRAVLESAGMTIFKNEIAFQGVLQLCVSVNKRLRSWAL